MEILNTWKKLSPLPMGKFIFSRFLGQMVPYTGTIKPYVVDLKPGHSVVKIKDRRKVRNHLRSIHAVALMNIAEAASGLATVAGLPKNGRAILTAFNTQFTKKARGTLTAEGKASVPQEIHDKQEVIATVHVRDESGEIVAEAKATWLVGPKK